MFTKCLYCLYASYTTFTKTALSFCMASSSKENAQAGQIWLSGIQKTLTDHLQNADEALAQAFMYVRTTQKLLRQALETINIEAITPAIIARQNTLFETVRTAIYNGEQENKKAITATNGFINELLNQQRLIYKAILTAYYIQIYDLLRSRASGPNDFAVIANKDGIIPGAQQALLLPQLTSLIRHIKATE